MRIRILLARLLAGLACVCGAYGLAGALMGRGLKFTVTGWFTAGTLLAVLALVVFADEHFSSRSERSG